MRNNTCYVFQMNAQKISTPRHNEYLVIYKTFSLESIPILMARGSRRHSDGEASTVTLQPQALHMGVREKAPLSVVLLTTRIRQDQ